MQFIETSVLGVRSNAITLRHHAGPLRFALFPMVHIAERAFYDEVAARAARCDLIVAEGVPARYAPAHAWMARFRTNHLVDQLVALDLEALGVPIRWEYTPREPRTAGEQAISRVTEAAGGIVLGVLGRTWRTLRGLPGIDQAEEYDDHWNAVEAGGLSGFLEDRISTRRDSALARVLGGLHEEHGGEPMTIAVVFGAAHMPSAAAHLTGGLGYDVAAAEWLTVASVA